MTSAILITREKTYPQEVLNSLPMFDEVIIETECPNIYRRYELAIQARGDIIYVQDDDCIIDVNALFQKYDGRLTYAITPHHLDFYKGSGIALIGYGAFFSKKMVDFTRYFKDYSIDPLFLSQADRVFSFLSPKNPVIMEIKNLPRATDKGRMSTSSDHWGNLERIQIRLAKLLK